MLVVCGGEIGFINDGFLLSGALPLVVLMVPAVWLVVAELGLRKAADLMVGASVCVCVCGRASAFDGAVLKQSCLVRCNAGRAVFPELGVLSTMAVAMALDGSEAPVLHSYLARAKKVTSASRNWTCKSWI